LTLRTGEAKSPIADERFAGRAGGLLRTFAGIVGWPAADAESEQNDGRDGCSTSNECCWMKHLRTSPRLRAPEESRGV
jgi:hypothetical protein